MLWQTNKSKHLGFYLNDVVLGIVVGAKTWITEVYSDAYRQKLIQSWNPLWCIDAVKLTQFFLLRCSVLCPGAGAWRRRRGTKLTQVRCEVDCYAGVHLHKDRMFWGKKLFHSLQKQIVGFLTIYIFHWIFPMTRAFLCIFLPAPRRGNTGLEVGVAR